MCSNMNSIIEHLCSPGCPSCPGASLCSHGGKAHCDSRDYGSMERSANLAPLRPVLNEAVLKLGAVEGTAFCSRHSAVSMGLEL